MLASTFWLLGCHLHLPPPPAVAPWDLPRPPDAAPEVTIRALHVATVAMPDRQAVDRAVGRGRPRAPISVYLLHHPTRGWWLIDAGYGRRTVDDPNTYPGRTASRAMDLEMGVPLVDRLGELGLTPADLQGVLVTHLHHDHAGGLEDLPEVPIWVHEREWYAGADHRTLGYHPAPYADRAPHLVTFAGTTGIGPFPHALDLFGDQTVYLIEAPGHTTGELLVLVQRPEHAYLFTGDAAWVDANWQRPRPVGYLPATLLSWDWRRGWDQLWRIHHWAARDPDHLTVISGHEPANLDRLPAWPATWE